MTATQRKQREITNESIDQTKPAFKIIDRCGGLTKFCEDFDYSTSTVYGWLVSGFIPTRLRPTPDGQLSHPAWIMRRAQELKLRPPVKAADFLESPEA